MRTQVSIEVSNINLLASSQLFITINNEKHFGVLFIMHIVSSVGKGFTLQLCRRPAVTKCCNAGGTYNTLQCRLTAQKLFFSQFSNLQVEVQEYHWALILSRILLCLFLVVPSHSWHSLAIRYATPIRALNFTQLSLLCL